MTTNLINKQHLVAVLDRVGESLNVMQDLNRQVDTLCGNTRLQDTAAGACRVLNNLVAGVLEGHYDACDEDVLAERAVVRYSEEEVEETAEVDPEEESVALGIIILPPCPSPAEAEELKAWYEKMGYTTKKHG